MQSKIQVDKDIYKTYKQEYNVYIKTAEANYIQHIIKVKGTATSLQTLRVPGG